jgi:hypothetical protein
MIDILKPQGTFSCKLVRDGRVAEARNFVTDGGKNTALTRYFGAYVFTPVSWYIGLVNDTGSTKFSNTDTMLSHPDWLEFTGYSTGATVRNNVGTGVVPARGLWVHSTPSNGAILTTTQAHFSIQSSGTLFGVFVTSDGAAGGTNGVLWSIAPWNNPLPVTPGEVLLVSYNLQM